MKQKINQNKLNRLLKKLKIYQKASYLQNRLNQAKKAAK